jgi:hypothetical protein
VLARFRLTPAAGSVRLLPVARRAHFPRAIVAPSPGPTSATATEHSSGIKLCSSKADLRNRPNEWLASTIAANRPRLSLGARLMPGPKVALTIRKTC